jgi:hypothetical protein
MAHSGEGVLVCTYIYFPPMKYLVLLKKKLFTINRLLTLNSVFLQYSEGT